MNIKNTWIAAICFSCLALATGCKDDPAPENPEELITTVTLTLDALGVGGEDVVFQWKDLDGDGGSAPIILQPDYLDDNRIYNGTIQFLNESVSPAEDITDEILAEGTEHQIFYQVSPSSFPITIGYADSDEKDADGKNIGTKIVLETGAGTLNGSLRIILKHAPNKSPLQPIDNPDGAGGETDADITFSAINIAD